MAYKRLVFIAYCNMDMAPKTTTKAAATPQNSSAKMMIRLLKTYIKPRLRALFVATVLMGVAAAMSGAVAFMIETILDDVITGEKQNLIVPVAMVMMIIFTVRGITTYIHTVMMAKISQSVVADIQRDLFSHFMVLDLAFFHKNPSGHLISHVVNDVQVVRAAIVDTLTGLGKSLLTVIALAAVMVMKDWKLSLVAFAVFPFLAFFVAKLSRKLRKVSRNTQIELGSLSDRLSQIFQGIRQVKAYGMEGHERVRAQQAIDKVKNLNVKQVRVSNLSTPINEILVGFILCAIILYGGHEAAAGRMSPGELIAFLAAFLMAYEPMKKLAQLNNKVHIGMGAAERIFDMLDLQPTIWNKENARPIQITKPDIQFENVRFAYEGSSVHALDGISFTAEPGKMTALVGRSGSGKTTIMNLIPRFYDAQSGNVFIEGQNVKDLTLESVRRQIALVSQDITIFDDTVLANIAYGDITASEERIIEAAKAAAAHDFIMTMPEGYQTRVGEEGVKLSGGQRQRISIARALLRDAPILLLDEATSALDNESEKAVQAALKILEKGRTTIAIAHRLSTVQSADQIIVLSEGKIVEQGNHDTLITQNGPYKKMVESGLQE